MTILFWNVGLTEQHLQAIGAVAVRWGQLENTISRIIWDLIKIRLDRGFAITTHLSERARVDMLKGIAHSIFGVRPLYEELETHLNHIVHDIYPKRNNVVHGNWGYGASGQPELLPIRARGPVKFGPRQEYTVDDITDIAEEIRGADETLEGISRKIAELLPTLSNWP